MQRQDHVERAVLALMGDWEALIHELEEEEGGLGWQARLERSNASVLSDATQCSSSSSSSSSDDSSHQFGECSRPAAALMTVGVEPTTPKFPNSYARQKHEIALLRQRAQALEENLERMAKPANSAVVSANSKSRRDARSSSWKGLAAEQRRRLLLAQRENRALRTSAAVQKRMAKNLQQILMRRVASTNVIMRDALRLAPSLVCRAGMSMNSDFTVFSSVCRDIVAISRTPTSALDVIQRKVPETPGLPQWYVRSDSSGGFFLESVYCVEVPFAKADVDHAFLVIQRQAKTSTSRYEPRIYGAPPGVKLTKSVVSCSSPTETDIFRVYHANRTFVGKSRSVTFQVAYIESAEEDRPLPGGTLKEHQWSVVTERTYVNAHTGLEMRSTMIQVVSAISPTRTYDAHWTKEVAENVVIPVWNQVISLGLQNLENTLMGQQRLQSHS